MIELETERLVMRPIGPDAVEPHIRLMNNPEVAASLTDDGKIRDYGTEWRAVASYIGHWQIRGYGFFSVFKKDTSDWIGRVGPWQPGGWPALEIGWTIDPAYWGKGYAPEAALATMRWTFDTFPDLSRLISVIDPRNKNSQSVAKKVGERKTDETFRIGALTADIWAVARDDWFERFADTADKA